MKGYRFLPALAGIAFASVLVVGQAFAAGQPQSDSLSSGTLNTSIWSKVLGRNSNLSMTKHPGWMSITTQTSANGQFAKAIYNMVMQPIAPSANWTVTVEASFFGIKLGPPAGTVQNFTNGGIYAWQDATDWVRMDWQPSTCYIGLGWDTAGKATYGDKTNVSKADQTAACLTANDPIWLRLVKSGDTYTGYFSLDGKTFSKTDSTTVPGVQPTYIGLHGDEGSGTGTAVVDVGFKDFTAGAAASGGTTSSITVTSSTASKVSSSTAASSTGASSTASGSASSALPKTGSSPLLPLAGLALVIGGALTAMRQRLHRAGR